MSTTATTVDKPPRRFPPPCWTQDEALALIQSYRNRWYALRRGYLRTADWDAVAEDVGRLCPGATPPKTSAQCRHKMEKLRQRYRAEKQRALSFPGPHFISTWFYFEAMDSMEKNSNGSNGEETKTGNDLTVYGGLNPGRGIRFKPGASGGQLVTVASRANNNVRASHNYAAQEEDIDIDNDNDNNNNNNNNNDDDDDEFENPYYVETLAGKSLGKTHRLLSSQNYAANVEQHPEIRPTKFSKIRSNSNPNPNYNHVPHGYWNESGNGYGNGNDDEDDENEDEVWMRMGRERGTVSMEYDERVKRGLGGHCLDGEGEGEFSRGVKRSSDDSIGQIVEAVKLLADGFVKMERMKMDMVHEIEKSRMEAEMRRNKMLLESQKQMVEAFVKGLSESKKQQQ